MAAIAGPVLGIELARNLGEARADNSPSIDQIDNTLGYVPSNVHVVSLLANSLKQDRSLAGLAEGKAGSEWQSWVAAKCWLPEKAAALCVASIRARR